MNIVETLGWLGSFIYIGSYFLLANKLIKKGRFYYFLNKIASLLIIIISYYKNTFQPIVINLIWLYISYLGYHNKVIQIKYLNRFFLHTTSLISLISFILLLVFSSIQVSIEFIAWYSVFAFSGSYLLFSTNKINQQIFHFYNFVAAVALIPKMVYFDNYQVVLLEILWASFALLGYYKNSKREDYLTLSS